MIGAGAKRKVQRVVLCLALTVLGACAGKDAGPAHTTDTARLKDVADARAGAATRVARSSCQQSRAEALQVSIDSIGGLALDAPLGQLLGRCPVATPTTLNSFESTSPAIAFPFDSLAVIGFQLGERLDLLRPADGWKVTGCGGRLPRGVSTCARWPELVAAYGDSGVGNTEFGPAIVRLRALHGYSFELDVTDSVIGSLETQPNLSRIPGTARLVHTTIVRSYLSQEAP